MKKLFSIFLLFFSIGANAQYLAPLDAKNSGARSVGILVTDSMQNMRFFDTATCKLAFPSKLAGRIARQSGRLYYNPTGTKFVLLDSVVSTSTFDTTNIYAQLELRVKYTDTAAMLANYLNSGDIGVSVQGYDANTTILGNATTGTGSIVRQGSPTLTLPSIAAINVSGGILSLPTGASGTLMRLSDTATLSARINLKLNIADTANKWITNVFRKTATDSVFYTKGGVNTFAYIDSTASGGGSGTVTSVATNNGTGITGGTITTTGTLAIDTTNIISTKAYRQKGIDSVNANVALKANIASPTFTGTVTIPTGANITTPNILGLTSGSTNDSLVVADPSTGALKRISSSRISSGGGGGADTSAWHRDGDAITTTRKFGSTTNQDIAFIANNTEFGRMYKNGAWAFNESATATATGSAAIGFGAAASALYGTTIGIFSQVNGLGGVALGNQARANHSYSICVATKGSGATAYATNRDDQILFGALTGMDFQTTAGTNDLQIKSSGIINIRNTPTYADNAAALAGGLVAGDIYRTSTGVLMIVY